VTPQTTYLLIAVLAAVIVLLLAWALVRWSRSRSLRKQFGPEYDHTVHATGDRAAAERELEHRRKVVAKADLRELDPTERREFAERWRRLQIEFVDRPRQAVEGADTLVTEVMRAKRYPEGDFENRLAAASVEHPTVVSDYRDARAIAERSRRGEATTEEMRRSLVCYRNLFQELLGIDEVPTAEVRPVAPPREVQR